MRQRVSMAKCITASVRKPIAIIGAVVAVIGGGLALWLLWWQPKQDREKVTDQVTAWEKKWDVARACLLGPHPLAGDASDALALAELGTGSVAGKPCTDEIGGIARDPGELLPDEVERAFG